LTGVYNRRLVLRLLERELSQARRSRAPLSVLLLDVDNFKSFNDACGHLAGDAVLRELAQIVVRTARASDIVGRFGGEEFLVVLPDTSVENAAVCAERMRRDVEEFGREHAHELGDRAPTISIGVCAVDPDKDNPASVLARADRALYASKKRG